MSCLWGVKINILARSPIEQRTAKKCNGYA
jgi:hypothetical protein